MAVSKLVMRLARAGKCGQALRAFHRYVRPRVAGKRGGITDAEVGRMRMAINKACGIR